MESNFGISTETLALFVRFWLTITPPLPNDAQAAAQVKGRDRYEGFAWAAVAEVPEPVARDT